MSRNLDRSYYFCIIFMPLILKTNSHIFNYSFVNYEENGVSTMSFTNLATGVHLFDVYSFVSVDQCDDHTFKFTTFCKDGLLLYQKINHRIQIDEGASLTIDENTIVKSVLEIRIETRTHVTMINSTVIADCLISTDCNITNSFAFLYKHIYNDVHNDIRNDVLDNILDIVNNGLYTNLNYDVPELTINEENTLIVLALNQSAFSRYSEDDKTVVLDHYDESNIEIHIKNVEKYCVKCNTLCNNIDYIMCIGNGPMSISRINKHHQKEYATDDELEEIKQKYHPKNHIRRYKCSELCDYKEHMRNLHYDSKLLDVEYAKDILTGIKYLNDYGDSVDEFASVFHKFGRCVNYIGECQIINVEKGAKLFMNDSTCGTHYCVNIKANKIVSLHDTTGYLKYNQYIQSTLLPNFLMKLIMNHETIEYEDLSCALTDYKSELLVGCVKKIMYSFV